MTKTTFYEILTLLTIMTSRHDKDRGADHHHKFNRTTKAMLDRPSDDNHTMTTTTPTVNHRLEARLLDDIYNQRSSGEDFPLSQYLRHYKL
jgi:hypothetical protein